MDRECQFATTPTGRRICYAEYGDPQGDALVYVHGWPSSRLQARLLDEPAADRGFRVIAPDRPGIGRSDPQPSRRLRDWPATVETLADHLGLPNFHTMGVSGGGPYALAAAHWLPQRVRAASVVCGAPPLKEFPDKTDLMVPYRLLLRLRPTAPVAMHALLPIARAIARQDPSGIPLRWVLGWLSHEDRKAVSSCPDHFGALMESFHEGIIQGAKQVVADADIYTDDWEIHYPSIEAPVDIWHGGRDRNLPLAMIKEIAGRIPTSRTHWLADEGHYSLPLNRSREILDSLRRLGTPT